MTFIIFKRDAIVIQAKVKYTKENANNGVMYKVHLNITCINKVFF